MFYYNINENRNEELSQREKNIKKDWTFNFYHRLE